MNAQAWLLDPKVRQAVHADDVCRHLVDSIHDAMEAGSITAADLGRHLKMTEAEVRLGISDPLSMRLGELLRVLDTLGITLFPAPPHRLTNRGAGDRDQPCAASYSEVSTSASVAATMSAIVTSGASSRRT